MEQFFVAAYAVTLNILTKIIMVSINTTAFSRQRLRKEPLPLVNLPVLFGDGSFVLLFALTLPALTMTGLKPICRNATSAAKILASKRGFRLHCLPTFDTFILGILPFFSAKNADVRSSKACRSWDGSLVPASCDKGDRPQPGNCLDDLSGGDGFFCHTKSGTKEPSMTQTLTTLQSNA